LSERELVKIALEYSDGKKVTLKGEDLKIWKNTLNSAMVLYQIHSELSSKDLAEYRKLWDKIEKRLKISDAYP